MIIKPKREITLSKPREQFLDKCKVKAQKMLPNRKAVSKTIRKAGHKFERLRNLPKCDALFQNISSFCDLLSDYIDGIYQNLPMATIVSVLAGLIYVVLPIDVLADFIPVLGWLDDAAVLAFVMAAEQNDVKEYLAWKENQVMVEID